MPKSSHLIFIIPALIWGSTWFVITYQLGVVDPLLSVSYRFGIAGILLLAYSKVRNLTLSFTPKQHLFIAIQGVLLFGLNYWLVYLSEQTLSSGLVAVAFSTIIFLNLFFAALILGDKIKKGVFFAALVGITGTILIYQSELKSLSFDTEKGLALILLVSSIVFASLGNIASAYNQGKFQLPVIQTNAFGMIYGSLAMLIVAVSSGVPIRFDLTSSYILSLSYLAIFGSIIAFTGYLTLIGRVGAGKAAYVIVTIPIIALTISALFEGYRPDIYAYIGLLLILIGNVMALRSR